jgi:drug/metabolite transporter (DMT)-like permease
LLPEQIKTPPTQQLATSATSQVDTTHADNSVTLAWIYGVELGIYMFLGYAFQAIGLETTTASRSGFLLYLNVKFVPFLSFLIFGKRIRNSTWFSALVAFTGTALLSLDNAGDTGSDGLNMSFTVGDLWSIAAAVASAMFILRMEAASKAVTKSSELNAANLWTVALLSLVWTMGISMNSSDGSTVAIATQQTFQRTLDTIVKHPLPLLYLSAVTTALANYIQSKAQKDVSAERASVIYAMDPVYGALFANILLGEQLGGWGWVGAGLIAFAAATNAIWDFGGLDEEDVDA